LQLPSITPCGDAAVLVELAQRIERPAVERVWSAYASIRSALGRSADDVVPAYASLLVRFDPQKVNMATMIARIRGALEQPSSGPAAAAQRRFRVGVCFAAEYALDLQAVATQTQLPVSQVIARLCSAEYRVAFLGFIAGFPYLLGLPPALQVARLPSPRKRVPAGSVAIASGQCGIYPREVPGGWNVLGRTTGEIFNPCDPEPALFQPGDTVEFVVAGTLASATIAQAACR